MVRASKKRLAKDPSAGGKRSAMPADEAGTDAPTEPQRDGPMFDGLRVLTDIVPTLPAGPGVYRMLNRRGEALYVGKAKSLKRRVNSYAQLARLPRRLQRMVAETASIEVVETGSEVEALLLESNLIKRLMPRYNVLLRDDKSFPYILITGDHRIAQITKHRGARSRDGDYFGPFASAGAVNRTITALERAGQPVNITDIKTGLINERVDRRIRTKRIDTARGKRILRDGRIFGIEPVQSHGVLPAAIQCLRTQLQSTDRLLLVQRIQAICRKPGAEINAIEIAE